MELLGIAVLIVSIVAVVWWLDVDKSVRVIAQTANRQAEAYSDFHKANLIDKYSKLKIDKTEYEKAVEAKNLIKSFDL